MMFKNSFIACIKVGGQILRENSNVVTLPFGSEYSILLKNLNSVRAQAKVSVDGVDATSGTWLVLSPNSDLELERFIKNGNWDRGNRFKFIERTEAVEKHRGVKADDGIIRVEFKMEQVVEEVPRKHYYDEWIPVPKPYNPWPWNRRRWPRKWEHGPWCSSGKLVAGQRKIHTPGSILRSSAVNGQNVSCSMTEASCSNDIGITVPGSESHQQFVSTAWFQTETNSHVIVINLRGEKGGQRVTKPLTVTTKLSCTSCGKTSKKGEEFCSKCGTGLVLI